MPTYAPWERQQNYGFTPMEDEQSRKLRLAAEKLAAGFSGRGDIYAQNASDAIPPAPNELRDSVADRLQGKTILPSSTAPDAETSSGYRSLPQKEDYDAARKERNEKESSKSGGQKAIEAVQGQRYTGSWKDTGEPSGGQKAIKAMQATGVSRKPDLADEYEQDEAKAKAAASDEPPKYKPSRIGAPPSSPGFNMEDVSKTAPAGGSTRITSPTPDGSTRIAPPPASTTRIAPPRGGGDREDEDYIPTPEEEKKMRETAAAPTPAAQAAPAAPTQAAPTPPAPAPEAPKPLVPMTEQEQREYDLMQASRKRAGMKAEPFPEGRTPYTAPPPSVAPPAPKEYDTSKPFWKNKTIRRETGGGFSYLDVNGKRQFLTSQQLQEAGLALPTSTDGTKNAGDWKALMDAAGKKFNKYPEKPRAAGTAASAAPGEQPLDVPGATAGKSGVAGMDATKEFKNEQEQAAKKKAGGTEPAVGAEIAGAMAKQAKQKADFMDMYMKAMNLSPEEEKRIETQKEAALKKYTDAMSNESKAVFWDRMIRGLGKVTAGAVGLHGLGAGGKSVIQPGLDVAKYYDPGATYDPSTGREAAKTALVQGLKGAETPLQRQKTKLAMMETMSKLGWTAADIDNYLKWGNLYKTEGETSTTNKQTAESHIVPDAATNAPNRGDKQEITVSGTSDVDKWIEHNRERVGASNAAVPVDIQTPESAMNHLKQSYPKDVSPVGLRKMLDEELAIDNNPNKATTRVKEKLAQVFSVPENVESPEYSVWYFDTYMPATKYGVVIGFPADRATTTKSGGKAVKTQDYFPDSNLYSAYNKVYSQQKGDDQQKHVATMDILRKKILRPAAVLEDTTGSRPPYVIPGTVAPRATPQGGTQLKGGPARR